MIQVENLTKEYDSTSGKDRPVLAADHLNFQIPAGAIFGLIGPNGAGKTTALKMICGLSVPTSGRVRVNGIDVEEQPEEAQRYIGYLADFFSLYDDLRVWEYLDYFARAYKLDPTAIPVRIREVLHLTGLESKRDSMVAGLSRGMKQRLGIGRAIIHDPPVLILDEPAAGLDPKARIELKDLLRQLHRAGKTVLITSHILSDLQEICTFVAIIEKGRLLRLGPLEDVMNEGTTLRKIRIRLATTGFGIEARLSTHAGVKDFTAMPAGAQFAFEGGELELAELVRGLILEGAPICGVEEVTETLEQMYSRISAGDVS